MKKIAIIILIIFAFCTTAKATQCGWQTFKESRLTLAFCQISHAVRGGTRDLLVKGRTRALNKYIESKIAAGKLEDKMFQIQINTISLSYLELTRGRNDYFVSISIWREPSLRELIAIVDYFALPDWQPFIACGARMGSGRRRIDNLLNSNIESEPFEFKPFTVWERDGVSLKFAGDSLQFFIDNEPFLIQAGTAVLPVRIHDRVLFFQNDAIHVVENEQTIRSLEWNMELELAPIRVDVHPKWVNIGRRNWDGSGIWFYSYSYEQNRFFRVENRYRRD